MELLPKNRITVEKYDQETDEYLKSFLLLNKRGPVIDGLWEIKLSMVWVKTIKKHIESKTWLQMDEISNYKETFWYELKIDWKIQIHVTRSVKWAYNECSIHMTLYRHTPNDVYRENLRFFIKWESVREKYKKTTIQTGEMLEKRRRMKDILIEWIQKKDEFDRYIETLPSEIKYLLKS